MARNVVASSLLLVYVAGSAWAVRHEGRTYREGLKRDRLAAASRHEPVERRPPAVAAVAAAAPAPAPAGQTELAETSSPSVTLHPSPAADAHALASLHDPHRPVPRSPALLPAPTASPPVPAEDAPERDPFWDNPRMKNVWGLDNLNAQDELRLGRELRDLVLTFAREVKDPSLLQRAEDAAEPYFAARRRKEIPYSVTVLDTDAVNAFSHPGGHVYVTRGLLDWLGEDQVHALEFAIAHEVAHLDLNHALTCLRDPDVKELGLGTLVQFLVLVFPRGYFPERLDDDADAWAFLQMTRLGRSRLKTLAFLRKLTGYAADNDFVDDRARLPRPGPGTSPFETHLQAHPAARKRLKRLLALTSPAP